MRLLTALLFSSCLCNLSFFVSFFVSFFFLSFIHSFFFFSSFLRIIPFFSIRCISSFSISIILFCNLLINPISFVIYILSFATYVTSFCDGQLCHLYFVICYLCQFILRWPVMSSIFCHLLPMSIHSEMAFICQNT